MNQKNKSGGTCMGLKGREIVSGDVNKLITLLNKAFADEWLAYYQYWIGGQIAQGALSRAIVPQFFEHAEDEKRHAGMLSKRILELGGIPLINPQAWSVNCNCPYAEPSNRHVRTLLEQNISAERCAVTVYKNLCDISHTVDIITYNMASSILADEVEHEDELQTLQEDFLVGMKE